MAYNFNDEDKEVREFSDRLGFGVHKVQLVLAEAGETEQGKAYIEVNVTTADGLEDAGRVWFTGKASNISFNTLRQIAVHNGKTEDEKEALRQAFDAVLDTDALAALVNEKLIGGELWITKYYDPTRTYTDKQGAQKRSINTNIYGYEPKLRPELMPRDQQAVNPADYKDEPFTEGPLAGSTPVSTANIPDNWAK